MGSLVFKWGSLVGISMPSEGESVTSPFVVGNVVFRPREFVGTITSTWTSVPYCTADFAPYDNTVVDHLITVHNPANGIGDICRYMGVVDGASWRIPTATDWAKIYGSAEINKGDAVRLGSGWVDGNYYPLSGCAFGAGRNGVKITGNGSDARVTNSDPKINGAIFLPASGYRNMYDNGVIYNIGSNGFFWSSTANNISNGYYMQFTSSTVYPQNIYPNSRTFAFSVRCIRE